MEGAVGVGGEFAEFLEFGDGPLGIERHGFSKVHPLGRLTGADFELTETKDLIGFVFSTFFFLPDSQAEERINAVGADPLFLLTGYCLVASVPG